MALTKIHIEPRPAESSAEGEACLRIAREGGERKTFLGMEAVIVSKPMRQVLAVAERVARSNASVLILGESGSGKELVARAIHHYSSRRQGPWVDVNCAALPEHLMESELFGYERGAFSGADGAKPGLFEMAHSGTIFLDEIGELESRMQVKLLRVLDGVPYYRLGGTRKVSVDVRVVAATNRDLLAAVEAGRFRNDLYHRLNQFTLKVPPLRERVEDIAPLARHFLAQQDESFTFTRSAIALMEAQSWPGNIRELRNAVISAVVWATGDQIDTDDFPGGIRGASHTIAGEPGFAVETVASQTVNKDVGAKGVMERTMAHRVANLDTLEKHAILNALAATGGHQQKAAARLGISRRTLYRKLKQYSPEEVSAAL
jgi:DNA-binding NtrC family response regulator